MRTPVHPKTERIYVKVSSDFDATGYMQPKTITWNDGRIFPIEKVKDFRPASLAGRIGDCYTVVIHGQEKHLFFERTDPLFSARFGRWFVERAAALE
ncbi:MAG: hypothetical protein Q4C91_17580 [Eubacteriales bacterium]|nr:hypothetical protein [Eubacteriales bacterium]